MPDPERSTTESSGDLPPIPDGGLAESFPDWLKARPAWASTPTSPAAPADIDDSPIDPRTLVAVEDLPPWLRDLAQRSLDGAVTLPDLPAGADDEAVTRTAEPIADDERAESTGETLSVPPAPAFHQESTPPPAAEAYAPVIGDRTIAASPLTLSSKETDPDTLRQWIVSGQVPVAKRSLWRDPVLLGLILLAILIVAAVGLYFLF